MTKEEAIEIIEGRNFYCIECIDRSEECCKALDMAIKALEQEPCEDCISRQDAEGIFREARRQLKPQDYKTAYEFNTRDLMLLNAEQLIHQLPPVTPQPSAKVDGDLISRDYVLSKFKEQCDRCGKYKENNGVMCRCCALDDAIDYVEDAPSAEKTAEETNLTSEELFALDIEQNVKDIDSGEDDSYYRGRLAGMLSAYRILKGKPYEEKETEDAK